MLTPDSFGLIRPNGHSSPMGLPHQPLTPGIQFSTLGQVIPSTVTTTATYEAGTCHFHNQNFFQLIQAMLAGCSMKGGEDMVDATAIGASQSGLEVFMGATPPVTAVPMTTERRPSLELVVDPQTVMESSGSTPPSTLETKKTPSLSLSPPSWPSISSDVSKYCVSNPTPAPYETEDRLNSNQMEIFTDSIQPDTDGIYFCHLCKYTGKRRQEFQTHLRSHYDHQCSKCDYTSRTEGRLRRHMGGFHSAVPPDNFSGKSSKPSNKLKLQKCKQCDYVAETKTDYWLHQRIHIKAGRQLECTQCPFVTEYRHHLEYHIRNHMGSKPYKCSKCNYECVNKSMLNSHMKSHTNVYQYRCADCNYATKYCHSLKMHLAKHKHTQAVVLNVDGSLPKRANALMIKPDHDALPRSQPLPPPPVSPILPLFPSGPPNFQADIPFVSSQENVALMTAFVLSMQQQAFPQISRPPLIPFPNFLNSSFDSDDVLDLSAPKPSNRVAKDAIQTSASVKYECRYCEIIFKNFTLFELHKEFHDTKDPFLCKQCGIRCQNSVEFFSHINQKEHGVV